MSVIRTISVEISMGITSQKVATERDTMLWDTLCDAGRDQLERALEKWAIQCHTKRLKVFPLQWPLRYLSRPPEALVDVS